MKSTVNFESVAVALNTQLEKCRIYNRKELENILKKCIPTKSYVNHFIAEMIEDSTLIKKYREKGEYDYVMQNIPIHYKKVEKWFNKLRKTKHHVKMAVESATAEQVNLFLDSLNPEEFAKFLKPHCAKKNCKLYIPSGIDMEAVEKLPEDIKEKIFKMQEV